MNLSLEMGRQRLREEGGIEHVMDTMKSLISSAAVMIQASAVLWNMALDCTDPAFTPDHYHTVVERSFLLS